jgi:MFS family permease
MIFLLLASFIGGIGDGLGMTTLTAWLTDIAPSNSRGVVIGLFRTFQDLRGFIGPIVFMMVYTNLTQLASFYIGIAFFVLNILLVIRLKITALSNI